MKVLKEIQLKNHFFDINLSKLAKQQSKLSYSKYHPLNKLDVNLSVLMQVIDQKVKLDRQMEDRQRDKQWYKIIL